ncbi:hypothetical protein [Actinoplanes sp. NPDC049802]|uniref:hypothetical protein n=1 Tax=Actinoplanes sp. NPDC049802 TaxID=3154742 RepID=UPI00340321E2
MRRRSAAAIVVTGAVAAIAAGSGLSAWAAWTVSAASGQAVLSGGTLPGVKKPDAALVGEVPTVSWEAVKLGTGQAVGGYLVFRNDGNDRSEVCRVAATALTCADDAAEVGRAVTYTVHATAGNRWVGPPSPISDLVIRPAGRLAPSPAAGAPKPPPSAGSPGTSGNSSGAQAGKTAGPGKTSNTPTPEAASSPSTEATSATPAPTTTAPETADPQ